MYEELGHSTLGLGNVQGLIVLKHTPSVLDTFMDGRKDAYSSSFVPVN